MAKLDRATLKAFFETNDFPTQAEFIDLIDSLFTLIDDNTIEKVIIVAVPIVGDGSGGKILKKDNAVIAMGEFGGDDTAITSDNGAFLAGGSSFVSPIEVSLYFDGDPRIKAGTNFSFIRSSPNSALLCEFSGGKHKLNLSADDEMRIGISTSFISFFGGLPTHAKQTITGSKAGNIALANLLIALDNLNLIEDNTT